jgi:hypothetical protein
MTKEDLAFIRALREQGVEVTLSKPDKSAGSLSEMPVKSVKSIPTKELGPAPNLTQRPVPSVGLPNYAAPNPNRILFDPNYVPPSGSKTFYDRLVDKGQSNSQLENLYEFFDITGISSYDDAAAAYDQWNRSGRTYPTVEEGVDMFGAVPALGKLGNIRYLNPNTIKKSFKNIPWQEIVNKADALQDMYQDDTTKDLPISTVPELQGGEVENKGVPYSPTITEGTNINIYQDQLNRIYPDQKVKVNGKWGPG